MMTDGTPNFFWYRVSLDILNLFSVVFNNSLFNHIEILPGCAGVCCVGVQGQDSETGGGEGEGIPVLPCRDYLH